MMKHILPLMIVTMVVLSGVGIIAAPQPHNTTVSTPSDNTPTHALHATNINWAGYVVETNLNSPQQNAVTDVKGSWIVPTVSGSVHPDTYSASWIGIDGFSSNTVEQIGTDSNVKNGVAVYDAWYEMFPRPPVYLTMTINPGDTMSAEVSYLGQKMFRLSITDVTTGDSFSTIQKFSDVATDVPFMPAVSGGPGHIIVGDTRPLPLLGLATTAPSDVYHMVQITAVSPMTHPASEEELLLGGPARSSAEWIIEAPSNALGEVLPLADFGTASFFNSQVTINGVTGSISNTHWQNDIIIMQTATPPPIVKAQPSPLSPDGTSFTVTWQQQ